MCSGCRVAVLRSRESGSAVWRLNGRHFWFPMSSNPRVLVSGTVAAGGPAIATPQFQLCALEILVPRTTGSCSWTELLPRLLTQPDGEGNAPAARSYSGSGRGPCALCSGERVYRDFLHYVRFHYSGKVSQISVIATSSSNRLALIEPEQVHGAAFVLVVVGGPVKKAHLSNSRERSSPTPDVDELHP